jgi:hypothetical protein
MTRFWASVSIALVGRPNAADPSQAAAIEGHRHRELLHGTLRNFGLKVGMVGMARFEARIKELVENLPDLAVLVEFTVGRPAGASRAARHPAPPIVREDDVCRRLMTMHRAPGPIPPAGTPRMLRCCVTGTASASFGQRRKSAFNAHDPSVEKQTVMLSRPAAGLEKIISTRSRPGSIGFGAGCALS